MEPLHWIFGQSCLFFVKKRINIVVSDEIVFFL